MAHKKRSKFKINKKQRKQLASIGIPVLAGLFGLLIGVFATKFISGRSMPKNIIWAADASVKVPKDLKTYLSSKNDCKSYRGPDSPNGVGLWGVYQVSENKYAKIAYGCSWNLTSYQMAVKQDGKWSLIKQVDYFAPFKDGVDPSKGALPYCAVVDKYKIPKNIEPFCINPDGSATSNNL